MINTGTWVGRLTSDPQLTFTPNGKAVTRFTIACERKFTNQNGEREADFIPCTVWGKQAESCANTLQKGDIVGGTGNIQTRKYTGQDGQTKYGWEVVFENVKFFSVKKWQNDTPSTVNTNDKQQTNTNTFRNTTGSNFEHTSGETHITNPFGQPVQISDSELPF